MMSRTTIFDGLVRTPSRRQRLIYWQTVPLRRLLPLLAAIFCLFGIVGFIVDLFSLGQKPVNTVVIWSLFTGVMAVSYLLVLTRRPHYVFVPVIAHLAGSWLIATLIHLLGSVLVHPTINSGVKVAASGILFLSMAACVFFLVFIQGEGRHSERIQTELSLAHGIQQTLVPAIHERTGPFEIYGVSFPSERVGGDLVDVVSLRDGSVFAYVADIAGHGLSAGILMGMVKTAVRTQLLDLPGTEAIFERLNDVLPHVKESHMYATCTALRLRPNGSASSFCVEYSIAGQPPILHFSTATGRVTRLADEQFPIGLLPGSRYRTLRVPVGVNDVLLVATDGVLDAENKQGEPFGLDRLEQLLRGGPREPLPTLAAKIHSNVQSAYEQADDQTLLLVRFPGA